MPALSAMMLFSIFIASSTHSVSPSATSSPSRDQHLHDRALHRDDDRAGAGGRGAPPEAPRRGLGLRAPPPGATAAASDSGTHIDTAKRLPLTSTSTSRRTFGSAPSASATGRRRASTTPRTGRGSSSTHLVECSSAAKSGCFEDGEVGRDRGGDPLDHRLLERPDHAGDGGRTVLAPHAELAGEVVVVLADLVAGLVAAVPAHAEARRRRAASRSDRARGGSVHRRRPRR